MHHKNTNRLRYSDEKPSPTVKEWQTRWCHTVTVRMKTNENDMGDK
jgi:hypothetical protein